MLGPDAFAVDVCGRTRSCVEKLLALAVYGQRRAGVQSGIELTSKFFQTFLELDSMIGIRCCDFGRGYGVQRVAPSSSSLALPSLENTRSVSLSIPSIQLS